MTSDFADKIRQSNLAVHRAEAGIYDAIHSEIFGSFEQRKIARDLGLIASALPQGSAVRALDIGCGTGNLTLKFLERGYRVTAADISREMIAILRSKLDAMASSQVEFVVADAEDMIDRGRSDQTWDIISFSSVLHHLPDYKTVLVSALRQLRPAGVLYVCHEPLRNPGAPAGLARRLAATTIGAMDNVYAYTRTYSVYLVEALRNGKMPKRIDYSWSDYHARQGIDASELLHDLEAAGATCLFFEKYRSLYSSVLAEMNARWNIMEPAQFRFIAQRRAETR